MTTPHTVTSLPTAPEAERKSRMIKYTIAMGVRLVCIGLCFVTPGWWMLIPASGAVLLPYFAVVVANQVTKSSPSNIPHSPGVVVRREGPPA
jgi:hypothetical protein